MQESLFFELEDRRTEGNLKTVTRHGRENGQLDVIVVGNFSVDTNIWPTGRIEDTLGGAPTYAGSTLAKLERKTGAFSFIGRDHYLEALSFCAAAGIDSEGLAVIEAETMKFQNIYDSLGNRRQVCTNVAPKLNIEQMPRRYLSSRAFYVSPLAGEVDTNLMKKLHARGILMLDPQGLMRTIEADGSVKVSFDTSRLREALELADIVKVGKDEVEASKMSDERILRTIQGFGVKAAIITRGKAPVKILADNKIDKIKTLDVAVEDPTGAGDVFGAAFLSEYMESGDPIKAAKFATASAGLKIRFRGASGFPSKNEASKYV